MSSRGAREVFHDLPWQQKNVVGEWLAAGHDLRSAIVRSNVLGTGEPITPLDAWREERWASDRQQTAEHESAHSVAASALGLKVQSAKIKEDGSGSCVHSNGTKLQNAIVIIAPELWIGRFRRDAFPHGPTGLKADHRALAEIRRHIDFAGRHGPLHGNPQTKPRNSARNRCSDREGGFPAMVMIRLPWLGLKSPNPPGPASEGAVVDNASMLTTTCGICGSPISEGEATVTVRHGPTTLDPTHLHYQRILLVSAGSYCPNGKPDYGKDLPWTAWKTVRVVQRGGSRSVLSSFLPAGVHQRNTTVKE
jgi:hypothetical protein